MSEHGGILTPHHHLRRMLGRNPAETHRASTPLELLFDLTFVIAFGTAANELAHLLAAGRVGAAVAGYAFATFAITWAWIQYSWFASGYDTDDWLFRLLTMVQMVGVLILALGLPAAFASIEHGAHLDNKVMVLGYVVMRVPMAIHWLRAAQANPTQRRTLQLTVLLLVLTQIIWVVLALIDFPLRTAFFLMLLPLALEVLPPLVLEFRPHGQSLTPWHPHHIAERYGLMVIIALGEGLLGATATLQALVGPDGPGWTGEVALLGLAGVGLIFGMWWVYFIIPFGEFLARNRNRSFDFGYGQIPLFGSLVAVGAGLHVAAYQIEHQSVLSSTATLASVAIPLAAYIGCVVAVYTAVTRSLDRFHLLLVAGTISILVVAFLLLAAGLPLSICLAALALAPWVTVIGFEAIGYQHLHDHFANVSE